MLTVRICVHDRFLCKEGVEREIEKGCKMANARCSP
jgi:hypothetical protein